MAKRYVVEHFSGGRWIDKGNTVEFQIDTEGGDTRLYEMSADELRNTLQYLAYVADDAAKQRTRGETIPLEVKAKVEVSLRPFTTFGFNVSGDLNSAILFFRDYDLDVGYELSTEQIESLSNGAKQTAAHLRARQRH